MPLVCRVARENSDARTVTYVNDEAFLSNFRAYAAHFSPPILHPAAITTAWVVMQELDRRSARRSGEFHAEIAAYGTQIVLLKGSL
jgi:hypothetical protein